MYNMMYSSHQFMYTRYFKTDEVHVMYHLMYSAHKSMYKRYLKIDKVHVINIDDELSIDEVFLL